MYNQNLRIKTPRKYKSGKCFQPNNLEFLVASQPHRLGRLWSQYLIISPLDLQKEKGRQLHLMSYFLTNHLRFTGSKCQGTGIDIDGDELEKPKVSLSERDQRNCYRFYYGSLTTEFSTESFLWIFLRKHSHRFYNGNLPTDFAMLQRKLDHGNCYKIITTELATNKEPWNLLRTNSYRNIYGVLPMECATEYIVYGIKSVAALQRK
ncbi:hypothetical protein LXL04_010769 [Taraxacum kok-saghyz]